MLSEFLSDDLPEDDQPHPVFITLAAREASATPGALNALLRIFGDTGRSKPVIVALAREMTAARSWVAAAEERAAQAARDDLLRVCP